MTSISSRSEPATGQRLQSALVLLATITFAVLIIRIAWISDDAYFTLRTVDNFLHGYGLTWNVDERVQAYTHPLWMILLLIAQSATRETFYTTILVSAGISILAFVTISRAIRTESIAAIGAVSVLIFSKAFVDYSTSGLENPLSHLLAAAFLLLFLRNGNPEPRHRLVWLGLIAGLATLNRMDTLLIYVPALIYLLSTNPRWRTVRSIALGFMPFAAWELFSLIYYGFPFPNPAYAKLLTGISHRDLMEQGYLYFMYSLHYDPLTLTMIAAGIAYAAAKRNWKELTMALGIVLYLVYVLRIGGDFMSGRYFTLPLVAAVVLVGRNVRELPSAEGLAILLFVLVLAYASPTPATTAVPHSNDPSMQTMIDDERSTYFVGSSLLYDRRDTIAPWGWRTDKGLALKASNAHVVVGATGIEAFFAGPRVHLIDEFGLGDPLLARMPPEIQKNWRIGHFLRAVPAGYVESIENQTNILKNRDVARYYDSLKLVVSGPIWSTQRFVAIWKLNTGQLSSLLWKPIR